MGLVAGCTTQPTTPSPAGPSRPATSTTAPVELGGVGDPYFPSYGNSGYDVANYDLKVKYDPKTGRLTATATITATASQALTRFHLDLHGLTVDKVTVDGADVAAKREGDELVITPAVVLRGGNTFVTVVQYGGVPEPIRSIHRERAGFIKTADGAIVVGEPESATTWFPANDHPRDKATYAIELTVPQKLAAISNGVLAGKSTQDGWTSWRWQVTSPMASYLAMLAIGDYRVKQSMHKGKPVLTAIASSIKSGGVIDKAIARTPEIIDFLESHFGPYPFDAAGGVVTSEITTALETQTRPIYSSASWENGQRHSTAAIAHELAHQWFGDSVSVDSWQHIWLNEGFATYANWMWGEHDGRKSVQDLFDLSYAAEPTGPIWDVAPGNPGRDNFLSASVYVRGAMTLHALRKKVGDDKFFTILKTWTVEQRDGNATTGEFIALSERISGQQLGTLFDEWLFKTGRPRLSSSR